jgi:chloramphenicol 3-O phosphotransferase
VALQADAGRLWVNLGVDASVRSTPERLRPGIGLRPGGERPDLEPAVATLYAALFEAVAAHARRGLDVVVDTGLHESYARPLHVQAQCARTLEGFPVLVVGVRCPVDVIWERRRSSWGQDRESAEPSLVEAVQRWEETVHAGTVYDLEVDTSLSTPAESAARIAVRVEDGPPGTALERWRDD